jgi:hypothetical protein
MHYKDGTPATLGDIIQHQVSGDVGILIGGQIGNDYCSSHAVMFKVPGLEYNHRGGLGYIGTLVDEKGKLLKQAAVLVAFDQASQTREFLKIGNISLGNIELGS